MADRLIAPIASIGIPAHQRLAEAQSTQTLTTGTLGLITEQWN